MSIFDELNDTTPPLSDRWVLGPWWCQDKDCFDVNDEALLAEDGKSVFWACDEGHKNRMEYNG